MFIHIKNKNCSRLVNLFIKMYNNDRMKYKCIMGGGNRACPVSSKRHGLIWLSKCLQDILTHSLTHTRTHARTHTCSSPPLIRPPLLQRCIGLIRRVAGHVGEEHYLLHGKVASEEQVTSCDRAYKRRIS